MTSAPPPRAIVPFRGPPTASKSPPTRSSQPTATSNMKTSGYNIMRDDSALLEEHERSPPSFAVHLYPDHWTLNNGPKFAYNNQVSSLLDDIRAFRIPTDFIAIFDDAGIPYYNGCMIVEILDFRPTRAREPLLERPDRQRVVLRPNAETIWADICTMNAKNGSTWSDMDALKLEEKLLLSTSTPLCLDPDPSLTRMVNSMLRVSTPNIPNSLKRKAAAMVDLEEDETEKAKRAKIMQFMNPQFNTTRKPFHPNYKILAILEQKRAAEAAAAQAASTQQNATAHPSSGTVAPINLPPNTMAPSSTSISQAQDKAPSTIVPMLTTSYSQSNTLPQPAPVTVPPTQIPTHLQQAVAPSQRLSPLKQQQNATENVPQRPPSQPGAAAQANSTNQQQQTQGQQQPQSAAFNPPIPPSNFLNPPPQSRRRSSTAVRPGSGTPAASNVSLPTQQSTNVTQSQSHQQPQTQPQPQTQSQPQPQTTPHPQNTLQPPQAQPQAPQPQTQTQTPQMHPAQQLPTNMQNMSQFYPPNGRPMNSTTAAAIAAVAAQRQALSGRNTPVNTIRQSTSSPAPPPAAMTRSPMIPQATIAAMMSGRNTPVAPNNQIARGSPLAAGHPTAANRASTVQNGSQQQPQSSLPGIQPATMQSAAAQNAYYQYQLTQQQQLALMRARMQQHQQQQQQQQQGHVTAASQQQQQQNQQAGNPQVQQNGQEQAAGVQTFPSVQIPPQMYNYMPMNPAQQQQQHQQQQQFLWRQGMIGRGMPQMPPNGQQQMPMPPGMTLQQMQGLGRGGGLQNR